VHNGFTNFYFIKEPEFLMSSINNVKY